MTTARLTRAERREQTRDDLIAAADRCSCPAASTPPRSTRSRRRRATRRARSTPTSPPRRTCSSPSTSGGRRTRRRRCGAVRGRRRGGARPHLGRHQRPDQPRRRLAGGVLRVLGARHPPPGAARALRRHPPARAAAGRRRPRARGRRARRRAARGGPAARRGQRRDADRPGARAPDAARGRRRGARRAHGPPAARRDREESDEARIPPRPPGVVRRGAQAVEGFLAQERMPRAELARLRSSASKRCSPTRASARRSTASASPPAPRARAASRRSTRRDDGALRRSRDRPALRRDALLEWVETRRRDEFYATATA